MTVERDSFISEAMVPEDPAHVMEQFGCRQHDGRISELVKAVEEELGVFIALGSGAGEPIPGLLPILFHIPAQERAVKRGKQMKTFGEEER